MQISVLEYLEESAKNFPEREAIIDSKETIHFRTLYQRAQAIAREIKKRSAEVQRPILVYLPKNAYSICAFAGIVYSRNFYVPTDVRFPFEKVKSVLNILEPAIIISDTENLKKLVENQIEESIIINLDDLDYTNEEVVSLPEQALDTDIVYTLFTSGSTGVPKGVMISHRSIIDYIDWARDCFNISENEVIGNQAPFYFDNSTLDIYLCLSSGATLNIIPEANFSFPVKLIQYINTNNINFVFWVPSVLVQVANANLLEQIPCTSLEKILFAGEVMPTKQLNYWRRHIPHALYANLYGPTEITVDCTFYIVDREFADDEPLPIGTACKNSGVLVLDQENKLIVPPKAGEIGELCVIGSSLALGYIRNPEKTKEVFVSNPINELYDEKMYRTGDLVCYNKQEELIFVGRKDFQIKHLGYRIELGEIETALSGLAEVAQCCVLYNQNQKEIVAFYEAVEQSQAKEIRKKLLMILPKYMIPTRYEVLDKLPITANGKIDRQQLEKVFQES